MDEKRNTEQNYAATEKSFSRLIIPAMPYQSDKIPDFADTCRKVYQRNGNSLVFQR